MIPTQDQVRHVARLARLFLTETEVIMYQEQLAGIFQYIDKLQEVDVSTISSAHHASRESMEMRKDEVMMDIPPEDLLSTTHQEVIGGHIAIPAIMRKKSL